MLMSIVLDPDAFDSGHFNAQVYSVQATAFFEGVIDNNVIVVDADKALIDEVKRKVEALPIKHKQRIRTLLEEVLKLGKRRVYRTPVKFIPPRGDKCSLATAKRILLECEVDALLVSDIYAAPVECREINPQQLVPLAEYVECAFEKHRRKMFRGNEVSDLLSLEEMEDLFYRAIKFSSRLRFYDPYIGQRENPEEFLAVINWILRIWHRSTVHNGTREVEIYTKLEHAVSKNKVFTHLETKHLNRLRAEYGISIKLFLKKDPDAKFHARYLESDTAIVLIERGFDLYDKTCKKIRRSEIRLCSTSATPLLEIRNMENA